VSKQLRRQLAREPETTSWCCLGATTARRKCTTSTTTKMCSGSCSSELFGSGSLAGLSCIGIALAKLNHHHRPQDLGSSTSESDAGLNFLVVGKCKNQILFISRQNLKLLGCSTDARATVAVGSRTHRPTIVKIPAVHPKTITVKA
jgi:hypothetical protein